MALIFTDGASKNNGKEDCMSSYGVFMIDGNDMSHKIGIEEQSTSQRGEVLALLEALKIGIELHKKTTEDIYIISDSDYGIRCIKNRWFIRWSMNGWLTAEDKPVKNQDIWEQFIELIDLIPVDNLHLFQIKGHAIDLNRVGDKKAIDDAYSMNPHHIEKELYAYCTIQLETRLTLDKRENLIMKFAEKNSDVIPPTDVFTKLIVGNLVVDIIAQKSLDVAYKAKIKTMMDAPDLQNEKFGWQ